MLSRRNSRWFHFAAFGCTLTLLVGCTSGKSQSWKFAQDWKPSKMMWWKSEEPAPPQVPTRLVSTWTETIHHRSDQSPERGFGGRINFFNEDSESPVRVEGQLVVYAFEEDNRAAHETQPTRRFIFPPEQFVRHESESKLGPSYSVWLPWDKVGGPQQKISLIARFEPVGGPLIVGEQTRHLLPGKLTEEMQKTLMAGQPASSQKEGNNVQLAGYSEEEELEEKPTVPQMSTATFNIPKRLGNSLSSSGGAARKPVQRAISPPALWPPQRLGASTSEKADAETNDAEPTAPARRPLGSQSLKDSLLETLPAQS